MATGAGAEEFPIGSLVACAGAGYANHAEEVVVPRNLVVRVPEGVEAEEAAFATLGAIALQGVRIHRPELGESVAVIGLGLLGLLTVQLLNAAGCRVIGTDPSPARVDLAKELGATEAWVLNREDLVDRFIDATDGYGVDGVVVTASTADNAPMVLAGDICRDRGRVTVVGAVRTEFDRNLYYNKELEVRLSRSYGPGRYDPAFEERGVEYPRGYVRFTETENLRSFLELVAAKKVRLQPLITHRYDFDDCLKAYEMLKSGSEPSMGIILRYRGEVSAPIERLAAKPQAKSIAKARPSVSFIGAGAFARGVLLPAFNGKVDLRGVTTGRGFTAASVAKAFRFGTIFETSSAIIADQETDLVVIATRHDTHARLTAEALVARKHVFVEKPLALDFEGLAAVEAAAARSPGVLQVGFNRRFAPMAKQMREMRAASSSPAMLSIRVNAGALPLGHWTTDDIEGGGRMVGEGCHFVDFARYIVGSPIESVRATAMGFGREGTATENFQTTLSFADGSVATIFYTAIGDGSFPKERFELFVGGSVCVIDDFSSFVKIAAGKKQKSRTLAKDKGHVAQVVALVEAIKQGGAPPIPVEELFEVSRATLAMPLALQLGETVRLADLDAGDSAPAPAIAG
ncbi:putative zinc-binding dehydrogenase [Vulgatibacter incomptus]|uniref:Putative zinc-binding dehydrogenase n=1 Tax=Vulgatibacter incomptus TaxID=1391653 RepID=A0A0K1PHT2_9BACT|nr:putative zinc-binding dehydrogenase [Vulgatibacter incomptus]